MDTQEPRLDSDIVVGDVNRDLDYEIDDVDVDTFEDIPNVPVEDTKTNEKGGSIKNVRNIAARSMLCLTSLGALVLDACVPEQVTEVVEKPAVTAPLPTSTKEDIEEVTPLPTLVENIPTEVVTNPAITEVLTEEVPTETPEPTATVQVESNIPKNVPTEKNENFDFNATDLLNWNEYQLVEVETLDVSETVETAYEGENHLYLMPLYDPENVYEDTAIVKLILPAGNKFNIKEKRLVTNRKGKMLTLGILEDSFAFSTLRTKFVLLLNAQDQDHEIQGFVEEKTGEVDIITGISSSEREDEADMVKAELLTFKRISEYQEKFGGFKSGEEVSLFDIIQPTDSFKTAVDGNRTGYLMGTEFFASVLNRFSQKEGSLIESVKFRKYIVGNLPGPFSMESGWWPTAVGLTKESDFVFKIASEDPDARYFFKIEPIFSNIDMAKSLQLHPEWKSYSNQDSRIIHGATISLVKELPDGQIEMIDTLIENYNQYIDNNATVPMIIPQGITMEKYDLKERNIRKLVGNGQPFPYIPISVFSKYVESIQR